MSESRRDQDQRIQDGSDSDAGGSAVGAREGEEKMMLNCKSCVAWKKAETVARCNVCGHVRPIEDVSDTCNVCAQKVNTRIGTMEKFVPTHGECRRHSPLPSKTGKSYFPTWPTTFEHQGCYEGIAKLVANKVKKAVKAANTKKKAAPKRATKAKTSAKKKGRSRK